MVNNNKKSNKEVAETLALLESQVLSLEKEVKRQSQDELNKSGDTLFTSSEIIRLGDGRRNSSLDVDLEEINLNARQPKSFKWSHSLITRRVNADDDYKVSFI